MNHFIAIIICVLLAVAGGWFARVILNLQAAMSVAIGMITGALAITVAVLGIREKALDISLKKMKLEQQQNRIVAPTEEHTSTYGGLPYQAILKKARAAQVEQELLYPKVIISNSREERAVGESDQD